MASMRTVLGFGVTLATLAITLSACSSGSTSTNNGSSPDGGTSGNDDGTNHGGSSGNPSNNGGDGELNDCSAVDNPKCSKAELDTYNACIQNACKDPLTECYGPGYMSGKFSGACADFIGCINACDCNDTQCFLNCPEPSAACNTCAAKLDTCGKTCEEPACMKMGGDTGGKTCSDLSTCCDAMTDEDEKQSCTSALGAADGNDTMCDAIYTSMCE